MSILLTLVAACSPVAGDQPALPGSGDPVREQFSLESADEYLAKASRGWQETNSCVSCHTNGLYLVSGAMEPAGEPWRDARTFALEYLDRYITDGVTPVGQYGAVEGMVATACFLAMGDSIRYGTFKDDTRAALDHVLSLQDEAGHWPDWLACNWPPYESDTHFGVTLMAVTLGRAPGEYRKQAHVATAQRRLVTWLQANPPGTLHQKGMMLWADAENGLELQSQEREQWISEIRSTQREDGGWCMASLGTWPRHDGSPQLEESEAYPTAFCLWVLSRCGVGNDDPDTRKAVSWLQANQRNSGRWFSRSQRRDTRHYLSNAATNMATMALRASARAPSRSDQPAKTGQSAD
ncbi:MAG: hypothetical protein MK116_12575 [Phycisphaerales bacterium]|nr:hypothetical protein [Phycisphaerales bacterium]